MTAPTRPTAAAVLKELALPDAQVLNLLALCRTPPYLDVWTEGPELLRRFARLLLQQGHPTLALEVAARGLDDRAYPRDTELMYCRALALARSGNPTRAAQLVRDLLDRTDLPPALRSDALALAGRVRAPPGSARPSTSTGKPSKSPPTPSPASTPPRSPS